MHLLLNTLKNGIKKDLRDSDFARNLYNHILGGKKAPTIVEIKTFATIAAKSDIIEEEDSFDTNKDYRLRRLLLKGIRKFPSKEGRYYSISFSDFGECKSSVFLGSNGVGKSSLFNALEMVGAGYMASAELRGYLTEEQQTKYLRHADISNEDTSIIVETADRKFHFQIGSPFSPLAFPAFFCMENDVLQISRRISSDYIAKQLGVSDYHQLLSLIEEQLANRKDFQVKYESDIAQLSNLNFKILVLKALTSLDWDNLRILNSALTLDLFDIDNHRLLRRHHHYIFRHLKKALSILSNQGQSESFMKYFESVMKESADKFLKNYEWDDPDDTTAKETCFLWIEIISRFKETIDNAGGINSRAGSIISIPRITEEIAKIEVETEKLSKKIHDTENESPLVMLTRQQMSDLTKTHQYLLSEYGEIIKEVVRNADRAFGYLMKPYFWKDIKAVSITASGGGMNIEINLEGCLPSSGVSLGAMQPQRYLNTFRFKIFCVSLKISLAFACKKFHHINFPIVIDDVFDSSDFSNREKIQEFTKNLWRCHKSIFKEDNRLQLIFFTQDDVISESVYRGIQESENEDRVKHARIYNYYEADEMDIHKEIIEGASCDIIKLEDSL